MSDPGLLKILSVGDITGDLLVPAYQRGYRWGEQEVRQLLDDIRDSDGATYYRNDIAVYGQESNETTWRMAKMNLAIRGIEADLGPRWADTFHEDRHADLKADYILANPPFNISGWGGERLRDDPRWSYGVPPAGNANYAWLQHMASDHAPAASPGSCWPTGRSPPSNPVRARSAKPWSNGTRVECIVAMPAQLLYSTQMPVSL